MKKIIFTIDIDAFFATCEEIKNPLLKKDPLVIGKSISKNNIERGVVTTCNYKARKLGIYAGMPLWKLSKLKEKINIVEPDFKYYSQASEKVFNIIKTFSQKIQISSIDECHIDVSEIIIKENFNVLEFAKIIQTTIFQKLLFPVSIGISNNILLSKMASWMKKPFGIETLFSNEVETKLWKYKVNKLYGSGKNISRILNDFGIDEIGDLARLKTNSIKTLELESLIGKKIYELIDLAKGNANDKLNLNYHQLKSISAGQTYPLALNEEELELEIKKHLKKILIKIKDRDLIGKSVFIKLKQKNENESFKREIIKQIQLDQYTNDFSLIYLKIVQVLDKLNTNSLIHITVGIKELKSNFYILNQIKFDDYIFKKNKENANSGTKENIKELIFKVNSHFSQNLIIDLESKLNNHKFKDKKIIDNDRIKFKANFDS